MSMVRPPRMGSGCVVSTRTSAPLTSAVALLGTVDAGEGLSAQPSGGIFGEGHEGRGMVDGNRPIVAGHVPVELGVTIVVTVEEADAITNGVVDVDYARGVDQIGNVDFEIAVGSGLARVVLQLISVFVGDAQDVEKQRVVGSLRAGILDWYGAVNAVPLAGEGESDFFADQGLAIGGDRNGCFEIGRSEERRVGKEWRS